MRASLPHYPIQLAGLIPTLLFIISFGFEALRKSEDQNVLGEHRGALAGVGYILLRVIRDQTSELRLLSSRLFLGPRLTKISGYDSRRWIFFSKGIEAICRAC